MRSSSPPRLNIRPRIKDTPEHEKQLASLRNKSAKAAAKLPPGSQRRRLEQDVAALDAALAGVPLDSVHTDMLVDMHRRTLDALGRLTPGTSSHTLCTRRAAALEAAIPSGQP